MQLALGTVQFGLDYGVSNAGGQVAMQEIEAILSLAKQNGISVLDTAAAYGNAELRLGELDAAKQFKIITKIGSNGESQPFRQQLELSLQKLNCSSVSGVMLHNAELLLGADADTNFQQIEQLKQLGLTNKIGLSVYSPQQLTRILDQYKIDLVQLPLNGFDQRFGEPGIIKQLKQQNIEVHCRSLFLQGLLLMPANQRPNWCQQFEAQFDSFEQACQKQQCSKLEGALSIQTPYQHFDFAVLGCTSAAELKQNLSAFSQAQNIQLPWHKLKVDDEQLILPVNWPV